jgi:DNA-binding NtrC family response regulator
MSARMKVLLVDDEPASLAALCGLLGREHEVDTCSSGAEALARLERSAYDLLMTDLSMPHPDGFHLMKQSTTLAPGMPVVVVTALDTARAAVQAIRLGARDFLVKPASAADVKDLLARLSTEQADREGRTALYGVVGHSAAIRRVQQLVPLFARCRESLLITGETGAGKETLARAVHACGPRRDRDFVAVEIATLPSERMESECFAVCEAKSGGGGASSPDPAGEAGAFQRAHLGTLYLNGIESFPLALQARLLRVIETGALPSGGAERERKVDVRVIASSAADLGELVARGRFRADLYFRLRQLEVTMPPLRERLEDLPLLAEHFLAETDPSPAGPRLTRTGLTVLRGHPWPGNCRELRGALRSAQLLANGQPIQPGHLPLALAGRHGPKDEPVSTLAEAEREHIRRALAQVKGNRSRAARLLGIDRGTLSRKLRVMGLEGEAS